MSFSDYNAPCRILIIRHAGSSKPRATIVTKARRTAGERVPVYTSVPHLRTLSHIQVREPTETEHNVRAQILSTGQLIHYIFFFLFFFFSFCRFHVWRHRRTADTYSPESLYSLQLKSPPLSQCDRAEKGGAKFKYRTAHGTRGQKKRKQLPRQLAF